MLRAEAQDFGKRLDWFVHERLPEYSRARLQGWIKTGRVRVNGAAARPSHTLRVGEEIEVEPGSLPPLRAEPEEIPLTILYEDADVIAIDKPAGMVVHAGAGHHRGTLVNALLHHFGQLSTTGGDLRPGIVHRLDRETSGVLIVARTDRIAIIRSASLFRSELLENALDPVALFDRVVEKERQLGDALQAKPLPDLPPQKRPGALERAS